MKLVIKVDNNNHVLKELFEKEGYRCIVTQHGVTVSCTEQISKSFIGTILNNYHKHIIENNGNIKLPIEYNIYDNYNRLPTALGSYSGSYHSHLSQYHV